MRVINVEKRNIIGRGKISRAMSSDESTQKENTHERWPVSEVSESVWRNLKWTKVGGRR